MLVTDVKSVGLPGCDERSESQIGEPFVTLDATSEASRKEGGVHNVVVGAASEASRKGVVHAALLVASPLATPPPCFAPGNTPSSFAPRTPFVLRSLQPPLILRSSHALTCLFFCLEGREPGPSFGLNASRAYAVMVVLEGRFTSCVLFVHVGLVRAGVRGVGAEVAADSPLTVPLRRK